VHTYGLTLFLIAAGFLLTGSLTLSLPNWIFFRLMAYVGENSYSIYLYHMLLSGVCLVLIKQNAFSKDHFWMIFSAYFAGSIFLGIFMARIVEFPMLRIRDRMFPDRIPSLSV
jgi:peptidoglycan/LPS O-acetylase OafA/YrhL